MLTTQFVEDPEGTQLNTYFTLSLKGKKTHVFNNFV